MQPQDLSMPKPPSSALKSRERQPTGSTHPTTAMSQKSRGLTPLKMPPLVQQTPRGAVFSSEQSLLGNPEDSNPCFISFRKSITETRSLATQIGRFTDSGSLSTATGHREEIPPQDEPHRQSMAVVIQDTPSIRDSGILPEIQEFRSFSPQDLPAPSVQNFPKSFTYGRAGLNTPLRDLHYAMPPAGPSTFLTEGATITSTRRSQLMSRETSAFGDEKKGPQILPAINERNIRHSLPSSNRAATARRQVSRQKKDTMWNGQKTVRLGIVNERRLIRHGVHHLTHKLGMECNFQLMHFGRQIGDLMSDLKREMKCQEDTNNMMDYQLWQLREMKEQIEKDTREATYDVTHIELTAHARAKKPATQDILY